MNSSDAAKNGLPGLANALAGTSTLPPGLAAFFTQPEVRGLYYNGKNIKLDGYKFIECRFDNCVLQANSDNFELIRCVVDPTTKIVYSQKITKIIRLFMSRLDWAATQFNQFFLPKRNPDGSITISDLE